MKNEDKINPKDRTREVEALYRRFSKTGRVRMRVRRMMWTLLWTLVVQPLSGVKRALDLLISLCLLLGFSPVLLPAYFISGHSLKRIPRLGRYCRPFDEYAFRGEDGLGGKIIRICRLTRWPVLLNIVCGDMSFVGPRAVSPEELSPQERAVWRRYNVRPGLISLWWVRQRANIAYGAELDTDLEYVEKHGLWADLGLSLRAIPAMLYGGGVATAQDQITLLQIPLHNLTMAESIEDIFSRLNRETPSQVCFVNADCANIAYKNAQYLRVLQGADLCLADGIGLKLGAKILGQDIKQNVNGTDLFPRLCEALSDTGKGLFLLGAKPGVAEAVAQWVRENAPGTALSGWRHGYFASEEETAVLEEIRGSGASLLLVAFGAPRQDLWISEHLNETGVKLAMGVGGLFDFYSGRLPRAPLWMREMGMEWLYRLIQEPGRLWKRYLIGNSVFLFRVIWERLFGDPGDARYRNKEA